MYSGSTLSHSDAVSAVELFEQGYTPKSVPISLDLARSPVQLLYSFGRGGGLSCVSADKGQGTLVVLNS
jgi:hypothetical protein